MRSDQPQQPGQTADRVLIHLGTEKASCCSTTTSCTYPFRGLKPNAIVALLIRIEPPVEKLSGGEYFRRHPDGPAIEFEDNRTVQLYPGDRAAGMLEILEQLRQMNLPVYVEVGATRGITRLLIPLLTRVAAIVEAGAEEFRVDLEAHTRALGSNETTRTSLSCLRPCIPRWQRKHG